MNLDLDFNATDALDDYLQRRTVEPQTDASHEMTIEMELELFQPDHMPSNSSVIQFWKLNKLKHSRLYEIAEAIYSIPPTECQIERDFSKLEFIFTQRRQRLSANTLEAILAINLNSDLFFSIKQEELSKILDEQNDELM